MIPASVVDQILQTAVIEEVIGDYVELKKSGTAYRGLSPFTSEKTPSFYVLPAKGIFKCFSSGKGGSLVSFLMEVESISYPEALRMLARRYNIEVEERPVSAEEQQALSERESLAALVSWAQKWFTAQLHETEEGQAIGLSYFAQRGFREDILRKFLIGYSPDAWEPMSQAALAAGFAPERLVATGLARKKEDGKLWDFFKGRVMFPIRDATGRVIGFGGRTLKKEANIAKYMNSPENALYHKGDVLYGIFEAKPAITKHDRVLLVEGYTDVLALHQAGVEHAVASSGTALTPGQIQLIRRFTTQVTVLFDGDAAGIRASLRGIDLLLEAGLKVQVLLFPDGDDPDSYARKVGSEAIQAFIAERAEDFVSFKIRTLLGEAGSDPLRRAEVIRSVVGSIAVIPDSIERSVFIQQSAGLLGVSEGLLVSEVNKAVLRRAEEREKEAVRERERAKRERERARRGEGGRGEGARYAPPIPPLPPVPPAPPLPAEPGPGGQAEDWGARAEPGWPVPPPAEVPDWATPAGWDAADPAAPAGDAVDREWTLPSPPAHVASGSIPGWDDAPPPLPPSPPFPAGADPGADEPPSWIPDLDTLPAPPPSAAELGAHPDAYPGAHPAPYPGDPGAYPDDLDWPLPTGLRPHAPRRHLLEKDLVRLLLNYGGHPVDVPVTQPDGGTERVRVPFAEWVLHHLHSEAIAIQHRECQRIVTFAAEALDRGEVPQMARLLQVPDPALQSVVADALMVQHVVSENWATKHQIYPELESDRLEKALADALHHLRLDDLQRQMQAVHAVLEGLAYMPENEQENILKERMLELMALDKVKVELARYFGTTILPND
jgi:DNA primase catalytic core